ncbi:bZIP transcription factor [Catellatospora sp. NPDC049111]|uniref:bZIP transcription factor n=1 Tax=Catellatospora sp. NPDC049111 TaxID=3155271 RepID=UPI00340AF746
MQQMQLDPSVLVAHYEQKVADLTTENVRLNAGVHQLQHEVLYLRAELAKAPDHGHPHSHGDAPTADQAEVGETGGDDGAAGVPALF